MSDSHITVADPHGFLFIGWSLMLASLLLIGSCTESPSPQHDEEVTRLEAPLTTTTDIDCNPDVRQIWVFLLPAASETRSQTYRITRAAQAGPCEVKPYWRDTLNGMQATYTLAPDSTVTILLVSESDWYTVTGQ